VVEKIENGPFIAQFLSWDNAFTFPLVISIVFVIVEFNLKQLENE
jgi:hypothetical protein